ncbi:hypothetical protein [Spirosoma oryzicola]|uniref:hypothetical protein n=1 Tax=Spirosoma oryzicola TaxID=2898794 RepID=UPI001E2CA3A8|nr:hypothetical protein [Spirosoma oryzicola]UHG94116.1 hypothetical protein LQ777_25605 [Spirosoma oryzicola]
MKKDFMSSMKEKTSTLRPSLLSTEENIKNQILVLDKLRDLIPPLANDEYDQLQQNILKHGVKDPLTVWETTPAAAQVDTDTSPLFVLIDGHNRYSICQQYKLDYRINLVRFSTLDEVKDYMIDYQLGRRNLTAEQTSYLRGLRYLQQKSMRGGNRAAENAQGDVAATLGKEYGVSSRTIKRDADFAAGLEKLAPGLKQDVLSGKKKLAKASINAIAKTEITESVQDADDLINGVSAPNVPGEKLSKAGEVTSKKSQILSLETTIRELATGKLNVQTCAQLIAKTDELRALLRAK